jgi:hypothetical protein
MKAGSTSAADKPSPASAAPSKRIRSQLPAFAAIDVSSRFGDHLPMRALPRPFPELARPPASSRPPWSISSSIARSPSAIRARRSSAPLSAIFPGLGRCCDQLRRLFCLCFFRAPRRDRRDPCDSATFHRDGGWRCRGGDLRGLPAFRVSRLKLRSPSISDGWRDNDIVSTLRDLTPICCPKWGPTTLSTVISTCREVENIPILLERLN